MGAVGAGRGAWLGRVTLIWSRVTACCACAVEMASGPAQRAEDRIVLARKRKRRLGGDPGLTR